MANTRKHTVPSDPHQHQHPPAAPQSIPSSTFAPMPTSNSTSTSMHRHRAESLSIARSPSIFASTQLAHQSTFLSDNSGDHHDAAYLPGAHGSTVPLRRTISHPPRQGQGTGRTKSLLANIPSEDDLPSTRPVTAFTKRTTSDGSQIRAYRSCSSTHSEVHPPDSDDSDGDIDLEALEHAHGLESFENGRGEDGDGAERGAYTAGFQKPDSKEMVAIGLSIVGVAVLSLAAGLTTVYDWVL